MIPFYSLNLNDKKMKINGQTPAKESLFSPPPFNIGSRLRPILTLAHANRIANKFEEDGNTCYYRLSTTNLTAINPNVLNRLFPCNITWDRILVGIHRNNSADNNKSNQQQQQLILTGSCYLVITGKLEIEIFEKKISQSDRGMTKDLCITIKKSSYHNFRSCLLNFGTFAEFCPYHSISATSQPNTFVDEKVKNITQSNGYTIEYNKMRAPSSDIFNDAKEDTRKKAAIKTLDTSEDATILSDSSYDSCVDEAIKELDPTKIGAVGGDLHCFSTDPSQSKSVILKLNCIAGKRILHIWASSLVLPSLKKPWLTVLAQDISKYIELDFKTTHLFLKSSYVPKPGDKNGSSLYQLSGFCYIISDEGFDEDKIIDKAYKARCAAEFVDSRQLIESIERKNILMFTHGYKQFMKASKLLGIDSSRPDNRTNEQVPVERNIPHRNQLTPRDSKEPAIQNSIYLLERITFQARIEEIVQKFSSNYCFFKVTCRSNKNGLTPAFFKKLFPGCEIQWDGIFTFLSAPIGPIVPTGKVIIVVNQGKDTRIILKSFHPKKSIAHLSFQGMNLICEKINHNHFFNLFKSAFMAEFPPHPDKCSKTKDSSTNMTKRQRDDYQVNASPSNTTVSPQKIKVTKARPKVDTPSTSDSEDVPSENVPRCLVHVVMNFAHLIIEKISKSKDEVAMIIYMKCLATRGVTFQEVSLKLRGLFQNVREDKLFVIKSTESTRKRPASDGSCFLLVKSGEINYNTMLESQAMGIVMHPDSGKFPVQTIARHIIDGNILMFAEGILRFGVKFKDVLKLVPKLPEESPSLSKPTSNIFLEGQPASITTKYNLNLSGQFQGMGIANPLQLPNLFSNGSKQPSTSSDITTPRGIANPKADADNISTISSSKTSNKKISEAEKKKENTRKNKKIKQKSGLNTPMMDTPTPPPSKIVTELLSLCTVKGQERLLRNSLEEERRNEFVGTYLKRALALGTIVIAVTNTPHCLTMAELKWVFDLDLLIKDKVLACHSMRKATGKTLIALRIVTNSPEEADKILAKNNSKVQGKQIKVKRTDFRDFESWLKSHWKSIGTMD